MSAKVIFLDIDGVLCTLRSHLAHHGRGGLWQAWDEVGCACLSRICETGVQLVISSTWRMGMDSPECMTDGSEASLTLALKKHDLFKHLRIPNWRTPQLGWGPTVIRGNEIAAYLKVNPDITDYRILDDDQDMQPDQLPFFIHTHGHDGMSGRNIMDLYDWAEIKP